MTYSQGHVSPLGQGKQWCKILSRSNMAVRSWGPDTILDVHVCNVTLTLEKWPWVTIMKHPWVIDSNCVKYYPDPTWQWRVTAQTPILGMCAQLPWPWRYDLGDMTLGHSHDTPLVHQQRLWEVLSISNKEVRSYGPNMDFEACLHCDLNLRDMTLGESNDTSLGHGQQLCEILSRSDTGVRSYGPDKMWTDRQGDSYIPPKLCLQGV